MNVMMSTTSTNLISRTNRTLIYYSTYRYVLPDLSSAAFIRLCSDEPLLRHASFICLRRQIFVNEHMVIVKMDNTVRRHLLEDM